MNLAAMFGASGVPEWMKTEQQATPGAGAVPGGPGAPANPAIAVQQPAAEAPTAATPATGGGTPKTAQPAAAPAAPAAPTTGMTFAQMQAQGIARPAPPPPTVSVASAGGGSPIRGQITGMLQQLMAKPSSYDDAAMLAELTKGARGIDDQFTQANRALDEEMARRGIYDSTIAGDKTRDLNVAKRSAQQNLLETLGIKRAETGSADLRAALAQAMGFDQTLSAEAQANADRSQSAALANANLALQSRGLDQNDADRVLRQMFGLEDIAIRREGMASDNANRALDRNQQADQFLKSFGLDTSKFEYGQRRDAADDAWRQGQFSYAKERDAAGDAFRDKSFEWQKGQDLWSRDFSTNNAMMQFLQLLSGQQFLPDGGGTSGGGAGGGYTPPAGGTYYPSTGGGTPLSWEELLAPFGY